MWVFVQDVYQTLRCVIFSENEVMYFIDDETKLFSPQNLSIGFEVNLFQNWLLYKFQKLCGRLYRKFIKLCFALGSLKIKWCHISLTMSQNCFFLKIGQLVLKTELLKTAYYKNFKSCVGFVQDIYQTVCCTGSLKIKWCHISFKMSQNSFPLKIGQLVLMTVLLKTACYTNFRSCASVCKRYLSNCVLHRFSENQVMSYFVYDEPKLISLQN